MVSLCGQNSPKLQAAFGVHREKYRRGKAHLLTKYQKRVIIQSRYMRRRPTPVRECGKILTLLYEAWLCFLTLLVEGLPLKFNTGRCVCKFDTVTPEPKLVKIGHVTRKCITTRSLYVNVSLRQVTKRLNDVNGTYAPEPWGSGIFLSTSHEAQAPARGGFFATAITP